MGGSSSTLYQYYTQGGIQSGLSADQSYLTLNGKNFTLYGTEYFYHRSFYTEWPDHLTRIRACGFNTVTMSIPWNIHQPLYDYGMFYLTELMNFTKEVQKHDLFLVARVGPYIDSGIDFGALPSWLLNNTDLVRMRSSDSRFLNPAASYLRTLLTMLAFFQFTNNGSIIAFQLEDGYGKAIDIFSPDRKYLDTLYNVTVTSNIRELLFTSDDPVQADSKGSIPNVLQTISTRPYMGDNVMQQMDKLQELQPNKPIMVMKYVLGADESWGQPLVDESISSYRNNVEMILQRGASLCINQFRSYDVYDLQNGGSIPLRGDQKDYRPGASPYALSALLFHNSNYTNKYNITKELLATHQIRGVTVPAMPPPLKVRVFPTITITGFVPLYPVLSSRYTVTIANATSMEFIRHSDGKSQSFGYISYQYTSIIPRNTTDINITIPYRISDAMLLFLGDKLVAPTQLTSELDFNGFGFWRQSTSEYLEKRDPQEHNYRLLITFVFENLGRINYGPLQQYSVQYKGFPPENGAPIVNGRVARFFECMKLDFQDPTWRDKITIPWSTKIPPKGTVAPGFYRGEITLNDDLRNANTFIDMSTWMKGVVLIDGIAVGRYMRVGPTQSLYLGSFMWTINRNVSSESNEFIIFENFQPSDGIYFSNDHVFR